MEKEQVGDCWEQVGKWLEQQREVTWAGFIGHNVLELFPLKPPPLR